MQQIFTEVLLHEENTCFHCCIVRHNCYNLNPTANLQRDGRLGSINITGLLSSCL